MVEQLKTKQNKAPSTLQVKTILIAMATNILELATKFGPRSPAWRLKLRGMIESISLIW